MRDAAKDLHVPRAFDSLEIDVFPEPTALERAAIVAALHAALTRTEFTERDCLPTWVEAGRRDGILGRTGGPRTGWGQRVPPL